MCDRKIKFFLFFLGMLVLSLQSVAQDSDRSNYFLKALRINSAFTMWEQGPEQFHKFYEITWSNQISVSLTESIYVGLQLYSIYTWGSYVSNENFRLPGVVIQYDFVLDRKPHGLF